MKLTVNWEAFGKSIRAQSAIDAIYLTEVEVCLGISHARLINAAQGKPVGTEIFLTICHWMGRDPMQFCSTQAIEARSGEPVGLDPKDESAVRKDAP